ncbi:MAG: histidinol-phosphate transaminase [Desulfobacteraceae bacterium]|nr:histidinol-phosphate transaminase [Desulfobacteraceae bacterium]
MMFSKRLKELKPYIPGEQPGDANYIKLNTNENPFGPSPRVKDILNTFDPENLRLYPDPLFKNLRSKLADKYGLLPNQVFAGNGSDEVLSFVFFAFFDTLNGNLIFPEHTYSFYPVYCDFYGISYQKIPLKSDFSIDINSFLKTHEIAGLIFPNPNAPTGILMPLKEVEDLIQRFPKDRLVVIDEAYIDFGGQSAVPLIDKYNNLLVIKTFSKSMSLAGIRLGYALGNEKLIAALFAVKDSFNSYPIDTLTLKIAEAAVSDMGYYDKINKKIIQNRKKLTLDLEQKGWNVLPSSANFIFTRKEGLSGSHVYKKFKEKGILVRHFNHDGIKDFVRITIGTDEMMESFMSVLKTEF